ncbi:hypothetical protein HC928_02895 [bacterium]|nr:hypothetical protein [bacterium]
MEISTRPIYYSLPSTYSHFASSENLTDSAYLVEYFEKVYFYWNQQLDNFLSFDGNYESFTYDQLQALAPFFGFSGDYFNDEWDKSTLISLFIGVYNPPFIWRFRGSQAVFEYVAESIGVIAKISKPGSFIAGISTASDVIGYPPSGRYDIIYPISYFEGSKELGEVKWLSKNFLPYQLQIALIPRNISN